jgi:glutathione S-transferase
MQLYYCDVLGGRKACAAARHLNAPVEFVYLDFAKGEQTAPAYLAINPNGKIPTLVDGEQVIWEADAILCHLSEKMGAGLWPHDGARQIEVIRWLSWSANHFTRAGGQLYFEYLIKPRFGLGPADPAMVEQALADFRRYAAILDDHLDGRDWLVGERPTVAEFSVGAVLPYAEEARIPVGEFANLSRWRDRLNGLDGWLEPYPAR